MTSLIKEGDRDRINRAQKLIIYIISLVVNYLKNSGSCWLIYSLIIQNIVHNYNNYHNLLRDFHYEFSH